MARTRESIAREAEQRAEITRRQRQARTAHRLRAGGFLVAIGTVVDGWSNGAITKVLDKGVLDHIDLHLSPGNLNATRLSIAGLYAGAGAVQLVMENRRRNRINHLELLAAQEAQFDRLATAIEFSNGLMPTERVPHESGETTYNPN